MKTISTFLLQWFYVAFFIWLWYSFIRYRQVIKSWTGDWWFAERRLWRWWTYVMMILLGLVLMFYWAVYPFWGLEFLFWNNHEIWKLQQTEKSGVDLQNPDAGN